MPAATPSAAAGAFATEIAPVSHSERASPIRADRKSTAAAGIPRAASTGSRDTFASPGPRPGVVEERRARRDRQRRCRVAAVQRAVRTDDEDGTGIRRFDEADRVETPAPGAGPRTRARAARATPPETRGAPSTTSRGAAAPLRRRSACLARHPQRPPWRCTCSRCRARTRPPRRRSARSCGRRRTRRCRCAPAPRGPLRRRRRGRGPRR